MGRGPLLAPRRAGTITAPPQTDVGLDLEVAEVDGSDGTQAHFELALQTLARMMLRTHRDRGYSKLNSPRKNASSSLTLLPTPSPHSNNDDGTD